jgi:uncharacterized protein
MTDIRVEDLYVYPVKGCRGIRLTESEVTRAGLGADRRYMVTDARGQFLTQRTHPALGQVHTSLSSTELRLGAKGHVSLYLPRELSAGPEAEIRIWRDEARALVSPEGSRWFSEVLRMEAQLVFMPDALLRQVNPKYGRDGDVVGFADAYPLLTVGLASLSDLNARLPVGTPALEMARFRPNMTLSGIDPFEEDDFEEVEIGELTFRRGRLCERCVVTTLHPETGQGGKEPLKTLATFRRWDGNVWFGSNWIPDGPGTISVGDIVRVRTRSPGRPPNSNGDEIRS